MEIENSLASMLFKVALFIVVQVLVYLILSNSSNVFSKAQRSYSFETARSVSIRRIAAALADVPAGGEPSPSSNDLKAFRSQKSMVKDHSS